MTGGREALRVAASVEGRMSATEGMLGSDVEAREEEDVKLERMRFIWTCGRLALYQYSSADDVEMAGGCPLDWMFS